MSCRGNEFLDFKNAASVHSEAIRKKRKWTEGERLREKPQSRSDK